MLALLYLNQKSQTRTYTLLKIKYQLSYMYDVCIGNRERSYTVKVVKHALRPEK